MIKTPEVEQRGLIIPHLKRMWKGIQDFLYGFFLHGMVEEVAGRRRESEDLFMLFMLGDLLGLPVVGGYYRFRLLPYYIRRIDRWKHRLIRPKDLFRSLKD